MAIAVATEALCATHSPKQSSMHARHRQKLPSASTLRGNRVRVTLLPRRVSLLEGLVSSERMDGGSGQCAIINEYEGPLKCILIRWDGLATEEGGGEEEKEGDASGMHPTMNPVDGTSWVAQADL